MRFRLYTALGSLLALVAFGYYASGRPNRSFR